MLERRAALDKLLSGVGPHAQEVSAMEGVHALWENAWKPNHAQEANASQMIPDSRKGARMVHVPKRDGALPSETPQGGVCGDADVPMRVTLASHDGVC